jgi:hypothetical protein
MVVAGTIFGLVYFATMKRTVALLARGDGWLKPGSLTLCRIGALIISLALAANLGAAPMLALFLGFLLARHIALRAARRTG